MLDYKVLVTKIKKINLVWVIFFLLVLNVFLLLFSFFISYKIDSAALINFFRDEIHVAFPFLARLNKDLDTTAGAFVVFEKDARVVISESNSNLRFSPASTTKIMTAIVALENYSEDAVFTVSDIEKVEGSKMKLVNGETIGMIDLLYGLLLVSGNDAAEVLAGNFSGGKPAFVDQMNKKASQLKLTNTYFVDPSGYDDANYTTAFDLARLAAYALDNKTFSNIVATYEKTVFDATGQISHELKNLNELLLQKGFSGVKTGFTEEAKGVLVSSFVHKGKTFISVVLKSGDRFLDTKEVVSKIVKKVQLVLY